MKNIEKIKDIISRRGALHVINGHNFYTEESVINCLQESLGVLKPPSKWTENKICPICKSSNIGWYLSSTKICKDCEHIFRAECLNETELK